MLTLWLSHIYQKFVTKKTLFERFIKKNLHIPDFFCIFAAVHARMHHKSARTYTQEQVNYDERILFIDRSAGSGADISGEQRKKTIYRPSLDDLKKVTWRKQN